LVALWVISSVPEDIPTAEGKNRRITDVDCPGARVKAPPPLITENGDERTPTFPVNGPIELDRFLMVMTWSDDWPTPAFPKLTGAGVTDMLIPGAATLTVPTMPMVQWGMQK
jgi:hypothetical protein